MALTAKPLQIFWQNFYRNVPWVVLYQKDDFSAQCSFWLVAMGTKMQKIEKISLKIISLETIWHIGLRLCRNILCISFYKFYVFLLLFLKTLDHFDWLPWRSKFKTKRKKISLKIISSETILNKGLRLCRNIPCISLYKFCGFIAFAQKLW